MCNKLTFKQQNDVIACLCSPPQSNMASIKQDNDDYISDM